MLSTNLVYTVLICLAGHPLGKRRDSVVNGAYLLRTALLVRAMTHAYTKTVLTPQGFRLR